MRRAPSGAGWAQRATRGALGLQVRVALLAGAVALLTGVTVAWWDHVAFYDRLVDRELEVVEAASQEASVRLGADLEGLQDLVLFLVRTPEVAGIVRARSSPQGIDPYDGSTEAEWEDQFAEPLSLMRALDDVYQAGFVGVADGGRAIGLVVLILDLRRVFERIARFTGLGERLYLADGRGELLLHPDPARTFGRDPDRPFPLDAQWPGITATIRPDPDGAGHYVTGPGAERKVVAFHPLRLETPWAYPATVLVERTFSDAVTDATRGRDLSALAVLLTVLGAAAAGTFAARSITRPLRRLTRALDAFTEGDADLPVPVDARDETGALARAFRTLRGRVREHTLDLRRSEGYLRAVLDRMADGLLVIDDRGRVEVFNPGAARMFGHEPAQVSGCNVSMLMAAPHRSCHDAYLARYRETGEAHIIGTTRELEACRRDGTVFPMELSVARVDTDRGPRFVGVVRDVSERKRQEASAAKSQFLANTSHELRTPLNAIIGYAELFIDDLGPRGEADIVEDLYKIRDAGRHLLDLLNTVLDISKIEAGAMDVNLEDVELAPLVASMMKALQPLAERRRNGLEVALAPDLGSIRTDVVKLRQVLWNLLGNAAKFTEDGTIRVEADREGPDPHGWLSLRVSDTGIGMDEAFLERVFEPFSQADGSSTRRHGGTGLGLAITRQYCELLGGNITVRSASGAGSTFTVRLPADAVRPLVLAETALTGADLVAGSAAGASAAVGEDEDAGA